MLIIRRTAVHAVPPAVDKTCCDYQHDEKGEPADKKDEATDKKGKATDKKGDEK